MSDKPRPSYLLKAGEHWCMVPPRIAALIESRTDIGLLRIRTRGVDPEAAAVLHDLRTAAMSWSGSAAGTAVDQSPEPAARSQVVTPSQAAGLLGITDRAIRKAITAGRLPATKVGNGWQIGREDLEHYRAARAA